MPKRKPTLYVDKHPEENFRVALKRRSSETESVYVAKKLGVTPATALKYIKDPLSMRLRDIKVFRLTDEELRSLF